jgi:hypothetical protein
LKQSLDAWAKLLSSDLAPGRRLQAGKHHQGCRVRIVQVERLDADTTSNSKVMLISDVLSLRTSFSGRDMLPQAPSLLAASASPGCSSASLAST